MLITYCAPAAKIASGVMKLKILAAILTLTFVSWAQTANQSSLPQEPAASSLKASACCCGRMGVTAGNETHKCCHRANQHYQQSNDANSHNGKTDSCCASMAKGGEGASCCKDAKSCANSSGTAKSGCAEKCGDDQSAGAGCCDTCAKDGKTACCVSAKKMKNWVNSRLQTDHL